MTTINNLNIFTFIKDIYQSLKNIDKTLNISNDEVNKRISKIEENQQILIDKMTNIELVLTKISEMSKPNSGLDKNIEFELLEKMKKLNQNDINNSKIVLKPNELTFANILENNYGFNDINESFSNIDTTIDTDIDYKFLENSNTTNTSTNNDSLYNLLF